MQDFLKAITNNFCNSGLESDFPQDHWAHHWEKKMRPDHCLISHGGSIDQLTVNPKSQRMTSKCGTVTEENSRGVDDPVQPPPRTTCLIRKPNSLVSLTGSDLDFLEDDEPAELKKRSSILSSSSSSSSSNQKRPTRLGRLPRSNSSSTSFSIFGNNNINDDSTPRIRTRPSLTPSLMSDRSSSPFTEAEKDINKGFFDDIEFPPEFGIPNNLHPASTPSNPSSLPSSKLHKPIESFRLLSSGAKHRLVWTGTKI
ncbi:hypothetical protein BY996DRAFT_8505248 [Phakopsora pachyrhizi]|nr:hypothetical protein BY996DRAFT_8505248 [Phakopsora pachyrhizi]